MILINEQNNCIKNYNDDDFVKKTEKQIKLENYFENNKEFLEREQGLFKF